ncbi:MAG TPA: helix-hairpin-helix domain-containing protein [Candidatus Dojkabacteria bacterium]|nr:helix-hairpin-helix domain-containing protein [Candidatus Dojkabacteria bacterium]HQF36257.1 helix-hairpin-helix domain-containing protein [Candidatus Dojkabacteria bacterium]
MNVFEKIAVLGPSAQFDTCGPKDFGNTTKIPGVYYAKTSNGGVCKLFKVLQTNVCQNNCNYCAYRKDRDTPRVLASADEMASAFMTVWNSRKVDGLFLSSGILKNPTYSMSQIIDTATILRKKYRYGGYVHLKIMPGSEKAAIEEAISLSNRISLNIESPTPDTLAALSPDKNWDKDFITTLDTISDIMKKRKFHGLKNPSITTQIVVGAGNEKDREIIDSAGNLYNQYKFKRIFYSAFRPVDNTPLANRPATSLTREHRLYQADSLMTQYGFQASEIPTDIFGLLNETIDPKKAWADLHPDLFPININTAKFNDLIRIPGIGPVSARKIIQFRKWRKLKDIHDIQKARIQWHKASTYLYF